MKLADLMVEPDMQTVGIVGAGGFIGNRAVEIMHLGGHVNVRPIVRQPGSLAGLSRFDLDLRLADPYDQNSLKIAFTGCDTLVILTAGDSKAILDTVAPVYNAACEAKVSRIVYMSSASVHGQSPAPGTSEDSPLTSVQPLAYNRAKVLAERKFFRLRERGSTELVVLRPAIVFGPRSRWVVDLANQLLAGTAYLIDRGAGICNSIYVDNLVEAILLALTTSGIDRQVFLLRDAEVVTWIDFYRPFAQALDIDLSDINYLPAQTFNHGLKDWAQHVRANRTVQKILPLFPSTLKRSVKAAITELLLPATAPLPPWVRTPAAIPLPSEEMCLLQECKIALPIEKAKTILGYEASVSFQEGCRRTIGWLEFTGYPVRGRDTATSGCDA